MTNIVNKNKLQKDKNILQKKNLETKIKKEISKKNICNDINQGSVNKKKLILAKVIRNQKYQEGTLTVVVTSSYRHHLYRKVIKTKKKYLVHHPMKQHVAINSDVLITQCAPISKKKRFCIENIKNKLQVKNIQNISTRSKNDT